NIGVSADYFAQTFPAARIVAVEPDPGNIALARRNCTAPSVDFIEAGIASLDGRATLADPGFGAWGLRTEREEEGPVALISIESILARYPDATPLLAKIDIEGFEAELFSRNTGWVARFPLIIIELHDWLMPGRATSANFLKTVASLNRDFTYRGENVFSFANEAREWLP
ncbi:MAG TPA: FkbM family methyltransferase, partial [Stellaceae bacterium]|nr:FkbM family methyltransferase [Stellaceae bacterium]